MLSQYALQVVSEHALQGRSAPGGCLLPNGVPGGATPTHRTATAAGGTHPTGMHSG